MNTRHIFLIACFVAGSAQAAAPNQLQLGRYAKLWTDSPFTSPPIVEGPGPVANPLEDYSLGGISKLSDGFFAILFNSKDPNEKVVIRPGAKSDFTIVKVDWADNWKETVVTLRKGSTQGTVTFDDKMITVNTAAPQAKAGAKPANPAAARPLIPGQTPTRKPRPRVVTPPKR